MKRKPPAVKATVRKTSDEDERAGEVATTNPAKRAVDSEKPDADERALVSSDHGAVGAKTPNADERAAGGETTNRSKRANVIETTNVGPRANETTTPRGKKRDNSQTSPTSDISFPQTQKALRRYVENFYDIQEMRLAAGGRTAKKPRKDKNGNPIPEIELHEFDKQNLEKQADALYAAEKIALDDVQACLWRIPFYKAVLSDKVLYKGIGPTMAGVILSSFDITKEDTVSQMWAFAGLRPMPCYRCKYCSAIVEEDEGNEGKITPLYLHPKIDKIKCITKGRAALGSVDVFTSGMAQRPQKGVKLNFNKWLRTKLVGVLGPVILKMSSFHCPECRKKVVNLKEVSGKATTAYAHAAEKDGDGNVVASTCPRAAVPLEKSELLRIDAPFRKFYDQYKHRKEQAGWGMNDGHRHNAAIRFMIKQLLLDIHTKWRTFEGLPVRPTYQEQYLGHTHHNRNGNQISNVSQRAEDNRGVGASRNQYETHDHAANRKADDVQIDRVSPFEVSEAILEEEAALAAQ